MKGHFAGGSHDHVGVPPASTATAADSSRPSPGLHVRGDHFGLEGLGHRIEDSFRARDDVLAMISHDLKNPLNAILLGVTSLEEGHDDRALQIIKRAAWRMKALITDLLDAQKMADGRIVLDLEPLTIDSLLEEVCELMAPHATAKAVTLKISAIGGVLVADRSKLIQVLANLVGNAIKFTPSAGKVTLKAEVIGDEVVFDVTDTGPGLPAGGRTHVFERYWQAGRMPQAGSGLGLYIAQKIVVAHGGRMWVESASCAGSVFRFTVPALRNR